MTDPALIDASEDGTGLDACGGARPAGENANATVLAAITVVASVNAQVERRIAIPPSVKSW
jgi:hypothetical protein